MRLLFEMDSGGYDRAGRAVVRNSARCVAIRGGRAAMIFSRKYSYYKFPGGGIEPGESREHALARETLEEAGLRVLPESVREYGCVHRVKKCREPEADFFVQDNFYYLCKVEETGLDQKLDDYEAEEGFTPVWVEPETAIAVNQKAVHSREMVERETRVLRLLIDEGYFAKG